MFGDTPPISGPTHFSSGIAPPSPPSSHNDPLDDIYGSPASTAFATDAPSNTSSLPEEILSDLPSRQRAHNTDAYREGLSNSKGQYVQEGFDEGYSLGANLGQRVGYILGVLQGILNALPKHEEQPKKEARDMLSLAERELTIQELLGQKFVDEEGIWKWHVQGKEEEVTFREVAEQHPVVARWTAKIKETAQKWGMALDALELSQHIDIDEQS